MKSWGLRRKSSRASVETASMDGDADKDSTGPGHSRTRLRDGTTNISPASSSASTTPGSSPVFGRRKDRSGSISESSASTKRSSGGPFPLMSFGKNQKLVLTQPKGEGTGKSSSQTASNGGSTSRRDRGSKSDRKDTPSRHASPFLIKPRPSSVVSLTSTADARGDLSFQSPPQSRRSLDEREAAARQAQLLSSSPKSKTDIRQPLQDSALAHLTSTQLRDEKLRQLKKSPSISSLQSAQSEAVSNAVRVLPPLADNTNTYAEGRVASERRRDVASPELPAADAEQVSGMPGTSPSEHVSGMPDISPAEQITGMPGSSQSNDLPEATAPEEETAHEVASRIPEATSEEVQTHDETQRKVTAESQRAQAMHESIGDSMDSALQAMKQIRGVAHLDSEDTRIAPGLPLTYTPRRRRHQSDQSPTKRGKYHPTSRAQAARPHAHLQLSFVRASPSATLHAVPSTRHPGSPLISLSAPSMLRCDDILCWTAERASRLAASIIALVGS